MGYEYEKFKFRFVAPVARQNCFIIEFTYYARVDSRSDSARAAHHLERDE